MSSRVGVNEAQKDAPSRTVIPASSSLLQRKCACGGSPGVTGNCSECDEKRLSVQRHAISRTEGALGPNHRHPIQTKLTVSEPGDKFEREADQIADAVMQRSEKSGEVIGEHEEDEIVQTKLVDEITPLIQRQMEGAEEEEEEEEEETVQTKRVPNATELVTDEEEDEKLARVTANLNQARAGGIPLSPAVRSNMERAFGVDLGQVRVHFDRAANDLTHALHAAAFTTGTDIFFREGFSDLAKNSGRRLLAHELTHVVQQNPQLRMHPPSGREVGPSNTPDRERSLEPNASQVRWGRAETAVAAVIQRDDPPAETEDSKVFIGRLLLIKRGKVTFSYRLFHSSTSPLRAGKYSARVIGKPPDAKIKAGGKELDITEIDWEEFEKNRKGVRLKLVITVERARPVDKGAEGTEGESTKPSEGTGGEGDKTEGEKTEGEKTEGEQTEGEQTEGEVGGDKEKGVEGGQGEGEKAEGEQGEGEPGEGEKAPGDKVGGETEQEGAEEGEEGQSGERGGGGGEKAPPEPPPDTEPPGEPGAESPSPEPVEEVPAEPEIQGEEGGKRGGKEAEMEVEGGVEGGKKGGTGKGTKPGSKYGWLGVLDLPEGVIEVLETMFELLGDSEEFLALTNLLKNLSEFDSHANELRSWFDEPDKLLRVALGLESSDAITALEVWAISAPEKRRRKLRSKGRGLGGILKKVNRVLEAVRSTLIPVFKTRARFIEAFGAAAGILEEIPVFEQLLEGVAKPGTPQFQGMLDELTIDFTAAIQRQLAAARATFKGKIEQLNESDFVTTEELARAIVSAARKALPPHARLGARILDDVGLLDGAADNVVAPLIPNEVLDGINGILKELFSALEPVFEAAEKVIDEILSTAESVLKDELAPLIKEVFMPQRANQLSRSSLQNDLGLLTLMQRSHARPLEPNLRREMASTMGFDFGSVRIHHDVASHRANQFMQANAFTVGSDIFFGSGTFAPETDLGRRLLAHELTHVVQQGQGLPSEIVQRDVKGLTKEIAAKYAEFLKEAKAFKASPQKKAEAAEMRAQVESLIGQPFSKVEKKLPHVYIVVRKKPRKIEIRRKPGWIFLVPKLKVVKGRLEFGFLSKYDPKAAARKQLRASLGCSKREQAHHIIPLELIDHKVCKLAVKNGFEFNKAENGVCLSKKVHSGSHQKYTDSIFDELEILLEDHQEGGTLKWTAELEQDFKAMIVRTRKNLKARKSKIR